MSGWFDSIPGGETDGCAWTRLEIVALSLVLLALCGIHALTVHADHNWGGDFAQYLNQAAQIVHGTPGGDTGYVYSPLSASIGPRAYPPGFPLLLAPVYAVFGLDIVAFHVMMLALQIAMFGMTYVVLRRRVSRATALTLTAMFGLSPYIIEFRREIRPDMPLTLIWLSILALVARRDVRSGRLGWPLIALVALSVLAPLVRTPGILIVAALVAAALLRERPLTRAATIAAIAATLGLVAARLVFGGGEESYLDQLRDVSWSRTSFHVVHYFVESMRGFWPGPSVPIAGHLVPILWMVVVPFIAAGFVLSVVASDWVIEIAVILHIALMLVWPSTQDLRFLYPVLPLLLLYGGIGWERVLSLVRARSALAARACVVVVLLTITAVYGVRTVKVLRASEPVADGPYSVASQQMFAAVKASTARDAVVVFFNPRVLAFYAERHSVAWAEHENADTQWAFLRSVGATHAIAKRSGIGSESGLVAAARRCPQAFRPIYQNSTFTLFELNFPAWCSCKGGGACSNSS